MQVLRRLFPVSDEETPKLNKVKVFEGILPGFQAISGSIVLGRNEYIKDSDVWLFGVFHENIHDEVSKYLQSNIFEKKLEKVDIETNAIAAMKKSCLMKESEGFASLIVIDADKFVAASCGGYRIVMCRNGIAIRIGKMQRNESKAHWSMSDFLRVKCLANDGFKNGQKSTKFTISLKEIDSETEFIVLASDGLWEVMSNKEAVDMISNIDDTQAAAEALAEEAVKRKSRSNVSCIVIRFY